jgi:hypothetical protein
MTLEHKYSSKQLVSSVQLICFAEFTYDECVLACHQSMIEPYRRTSSYNEFIHSMLFIKLTTCVIINEVIRLTLDADEDE